MNRIVKLKTCLLLCLASFALAAQPPKDTLSVELTMAARPQSTLGGTLLAFKGKKPVPLVMIIAGSGPTDRNGNNPAMQNNSLKYLAESLAQQGVASFRYDKRGVGASAKAMVREDSLTFETYINDAAAWIAFLRKDRRFSKIIVAGHSEGALTGMVAAAKAKADGYISIAGAGRPAAQIIRQQLQPQPEAIKAEAGKILDSLQAGKLVARPNPMFVALFRPSVQPYLVSWFKYDPVVEIRKLSVPVLVVQGTTDAQVTVEDARLLAAAAPSAKLVVIDGMNHILKEAEADLQKNTATYNVPALPLKPELAAHLQGFLRQFR